MSIIVIELILKQIILIIGLSVDFDWSSFRMNFIVSLIFLFLSIFISVVLIPHFTVRLLRKKRKKYIITKISYIIQEFCEFIENTSFKNSDINSERLSIYTSKRDLKFHRFLGIVDFNVLNEMTHLLFRKEILGRSAMLNPDEEFDLVKTEKNKLDKFRSKLESIISFHSLDIDEEIISDVSQLCLEIRAFEIRYNYNFGMDDLIEKGEAERVYVVGIREIGEIYELILKLFKELLTLKIITVKIEKIN